MVQLFTVFCICIHQFHMYVSATYTPARACTHATLVGNKQSLVAATTRKGDFEEIGEALGNLTVQSGMDG